MLVTGTYEDAKAFSDKMSCDHRIGACLIEEFNVENEIVNLMLYPWHDQEVNVQKAEDSIERLTEMDVPDECVGIVKAYCDIMRKVIKLDQWERYMDMV